MNIIDNAATSKVVNASPGDTEHQLPLDLWLKGRDPNNPKLDIYEWEMLGENFARLIQKVLFEVKPASDLIFHLSQHSLKATHIAREGGFTISAEAAITPLRHMSSDDIFFSIGRRQAEKAKAAFSRWPVLTCRYEKNKSVLGVTSKDCRVPLIAKPILDIERPPELTVFTQLDALRLRSACSTACLFYGRKVGRLTARRDLIIKDGYAVHWYPYAAARYPIAHSSEFAIPGELIPNFLNWPRVAAVRLP